jgi:MFS family permease
MKVVQRPGQIQPAAVCLIITGTLNAALGMLGVISALVRISKPAMRPPMRNEAERLGYEAGQFGGLLVFFLSFIVAPMIIYGALKMLNGTNSNWAKAAAILAIIPFTSCCFLIGAPVGIWALVVLGKPEVKLFFERGGANYQPPPPEYFSST